MHNQRKNRVSDKRGEKIQLLFLSFIYSLSQLTNIHLFYYLLTGKQSVNISVCKEYFGGKKLF